MINEPTYYMRCYYNFDEVIFKVPPVEDYLQMRKDQFSKKKFNSHISQNVRLFKGYRKRFRQLNDNFIKKGVVK